jgi:WD40 repeat protein
MELRVGEIVAMAVKEAVLDPLHAELERTLAGHTDAVECMVVHGDKLISSSGDLTIKVWSTDTWTCEDTLEGHTDYAFSLVVHGGKLSSASYDKAIKVWSINTWACKRTLEGHTDEVIALVVHQCSVHGDNLLSDQRMGARPPGFGFAWP